MTKLLCTVALSALACLQHSAASADDDDQDAERAACLCLEVDDTVTAYFSQRPQSYGQQNELFVRVSGCVEQLVQRPCNSIIDYDGPIRPISMVRRA